MTESPTPTHVENPRFAAARDVINAGLESRAFPAAVVEVGRTQQPIWRQAFGRLSYDAGAPACVDDTIFDLASLTKVIATTPLVMRAVATGTLALDTPVSDLLPDWRGGLREFVRVRHLLDHSSGLPAHARFWEEAGGRDAVARAIGGLVLGHAPGARAIYSDPGFILLGLILESVASASLDSQFATLPIGDVDALRFLPPEDLRDRIAPTENDPWRGRVLQGDVHDENAAALGGVAGHAGLFGTAAAVGSFARTVLATFHDPTWLATPETLRRFATPSAVPASSRALGWDTMRPTSSCGTRFSPTSIGHTGFTGTSLWIDRERDLYVVFLTNRVHPSRAHSALVTLRPRLHDAIVEDLRGS